MEKSKNIKLKIPNISKGEKVYISYSKIGLYKSCPRQYYYKYLRSDLKEKQTIWPGNLVGQTMHHVLENLIKDKNAGMSDKTIILKYKNKFMDVYDQLVTEAGKDYKNSKETKSGLKDFTKKNNKILNSFIKLVLKYFFENEKIIKVEPEKKYTIEWIWDKDVVLTGLLDVEVMLNNSEYKIFDLKVTKDSSIYFCVDWIRAYQKIIYEYFIWQTYNILPKKFGYIVIDRENKFIFFKDKKNKKDIDFEKHFSELKKVITELKAFILNPDLSLVNPEETRCKWCAFNKHCEHKWESPLIKKAKKLLNK